MKNPSENSRSGFTLIELLVAMAITTIIVTVLVSVTSMAMDTWNRSRAEIRAARQAKSMIDSMARDLESFVSRQGNTAEWLYAKSNPSTEGPKGLASPNAIDLVFFTAATDRYDGKIGSTDDKGGDVSTVGYKLVYKDPIAGAANDEFKTFVLYRKLVNPDVTFTNILGQARIQDPFEKAVNTGDTDPKIDQEENFICENVYQFTVTFHVTTTPNVDGTPFTYVKPVALPLTTLTAGEEPEFRITGNGIDVDDITPRELNSPDKNISTKLTTGGVLQASRLSAVEISVTVLSDFGIQQMRRRTNLGNSTARLADFVAKNSFQYSKVVQLPGF
jgi:prepilin-type N-terminal cleavage/methylation domain-containing protein